jgi:hypothetical protein
MKARKLLRGRKCRICCNLAFENFGLEKSAQWEALTEKNGSKGKKVAKKFAES